MIIFSERSLGRKYVEICLDYRNIKILQKYEETKK